MKPNPNWRGDPTFLPEVLRYWGVEVNEMPGWRNIGHGDFDKIQGIVVHHTGTNKNIPGYIQNHPQLGLCSQIHLSREGVVDLCGVGIAHHAGRGSYPGWPTNNANKVSIGIEAASDGQSAWPEAEMVAYRKTCAAILWFLGKRAIPQALISHHEYSGHAQGKWDPGVGGKPWDMNKFRAEVNWYIDNPPFKAGEKGAPKVSNENETIAFRRVHEAAIHDAKVAAQQGAARIDLVENKLDLILDQLVGPGKDAQGGRTFTGWPAIGDFAGTDGKTLVEMVAELKKGGK